jgi:poly-gamma-glutamate capsule biosynthesis protein CapA/YwtB (metallophosphatase superfamily)
VKKRNHPVLAFVGDVMLGRMVDEQIPLRAPSTFWGTARPLLVNADVVFANLECAITPATREWRPREKVFHFRARPEAVEVLRAGNIGCVSLANNHVLDFDRVGLLDTLDCLDAANIKRAGAGRTLREAMTPAIIEAGGLRISFTALTNNEPELAAGEDRPGVFYLDVEDRGRWAAALSEAASLVDAENPDLRILSGHLGPNMVSEPKQLFVEFTEAALTYGFDIYYGHSAHVLQGARAFEGKLILHDTGDFLDDYAVDPAQHNDWSAVFQVDIVDGAPRSLRISPVQLGLARVDCAEGLVASNIVERMFSNCEKLGSLPVCDDEGLTIYIAQT